jgi:SAM-dependent methyltransferase
MSAAAPAVQFTEKTPCPLCLTNGPSRKAFVSKARGACSFSDKVFDVIKCTACDLGITQPAVTTESISLLYEPRTSNDFPPHEKGIWKFVKPSYVRLTIRNILRPKFIQSHKLRKILDYGCGIGDFSIGLSREVRSAAVVATDFPADPPENLRHHPAVRYLQNDDLIRENGTFDLIFCRHVLEHTNNPLAFLSGIRNLLNENGIAFFEVPNLNTPWKFLFRQYWMVFYAPYHFFHYTPRSLKTLLLKAGFEVECVRGGDLPVFDRSLQALFNSEWYFPFFLAGLLLYPLQILAGVLTGRRTVVYAYARKKAGVHEV